MHWHDYLALSLVAASAAFVLTRAYCALFGAAKPGCGSGCGSCGGGSAAARPAKLMSIE